MENVMSDVWQLETPKEEMYCNIINNFYEKATKGDRNLQNGLKRWFESDWQTIQKRFETEGSVWYVWYMDGVRNYMREMLQ